MKDRIILLNLPPAIDFSYNNKGAIYPSAALLIIGTLLTDKGYEVIIIDGAYQENYLKLLADTLTSKTAFVGMSVMTTQVSLFQKISKLLSFYSNYALSNYQKKSGPLKSLLFEVLRVFSRLRLRIFYFGFPFEYWIYSFLNIK